MKKLVKQVVVVMIGIVFACFFSSQVIAEETEETIDICFSDCCSHMHDNVSDGLNNSADNSEYISENTIYTNSNVSLPSSVNLSATSYFPPIREQVGGSCGAWSSTYYQFTYEVAKKFGWNAKENDDYVFSPMYVWNYLNDGEDQGVFPTDCYNFLKNGCVRWSEFAHEEPLSMEWYSGSSATLREALKTRVTNATSLNLSANTATLITSNNDEDLRIIKEYLGVHRKVLNIITDCSSGKAVLLNNGQYGIVRGEGASQPHALTIVGYNDNISYDYNGNEKIDENEKGAFLIANSWGTNADNHDLGLVWLMYDALNSTSIHSSQNTNSRKPFVRDNLFWYIDVTGPNDPLPERMVEVVVQQQQRNDFTITLGRSSTKNGAKTIRNTFLTQKGGALSFSGGAPATQTRRFVFSYDSLYSGDDKVYWIGVTDHSGASTTRVQQIIWYNSEEEVICTKPQQSAINNNVGWYYCTLPISNITINNANNNLLVGDTQQLSVTITPNNATDTAVTWSSSNSNIISVSSSGLVTCKASGTATITVRATDGSGIVSTYNYVIADDYSNSFDDAYVVVNHTKTNGKINTVGDCDWFEFTPYTTELFLLYSTGSADTSVNIYDSTNTLLYSNDDSSGTNLNFAVKCNLSAGQQYYIQVSAYGETTGAYTLCVSKVLYSASLASNNQDARKVLMQAEGSSMFTTLTIVHKNKSYVLNKPASGDLDVVVNGQRFKVTFTDANGGLSTIWDITATLPATTIDSVVTNTQTIRFQFSYGAINMTKTVYGYVGYGSYFVTGLDDRATGNLQTLINTLRTYHTNESFEVWNWDNSLVNVSSSTKGATGMKIIHKQDNYIVGVYYLVVFGDINGTGTPNLGDGAVNAQDALKVLQESVDKTDLEPLALIAADANHDGLIDANDALLINKHAVQKDTIVQAYPISVAVPDECYLYSPVIF